MTELHYLELVELTELVSKAVEQEYPDAEIDGDMDTTILD